MSQIKFLTKGACVALTSLVLWAASLGVILAGGVLVAAATPCLCFDANGLMLAGGLGVILVGAAMLLWSGELARRFSDRLAGWLVERDDAVARETPTNMRDGS